MADLEISYFLFCLAWQNMTKMSLRFEGIFGIRHQVRGDQANPL